MSDANQKEAAENLRSAAIELHDAAVGLRDALRRLGEAADIPEDNCAASKDSETSETSGAPGIAEASAAQISAPDASVSDESAPNASGPDASVSDVSVTNASAAAPSTKNDTPPSPVLEVKGISKRFGGLRALSDIDLTVNKGEVVALIGPNGAGKTTLFNCVTSIYTPEEGSIVLHAPDGSSHSLMEKKPFEVTALGMARTFQNIRLFPTMTVLENVMIARHCRTKAGILGALLRLPSVRREEKQIEESSYALLAYMGLEDVFEEEARNLSYGQQRRLEIARALATNPHLLLLDEPAAGMNPHETAALKDMVTKIRDEFNLSILLIEHDMNMVMSISDRIYVVEYGCNLAEGSPLEVRENPQVIRAYLGESDA